MSIFKPKTKLVDYETEDSIPSFYVDANGYILFDDDDLGGAAVFEIIPGAMTESMTHCDPVTMKSTSDDHYKSQTGSYFGDSRLTAIPAWIEFLNNLQPKDDDDDLIHIQILAKHCIMSEWDESASTRGGYASEKVRKSIEQMDRVMFGRRPTLKDALMRARLIDYAEEIDAASTHDLSTRKSSFDVRQIPAYKIKYFLVVSYTPSSEGWWMDGRDSDYYVSDNASSVMSLFDDDRAAENITNFIMKHRRNKDKGQENTADDFFYVRADETAQVLYSRVKRIEKCVDDWNRTHLIQPMPFTLRRLDMRESAALIAMFPNIVTPYWDRIWELKDDINQVLYGLEADIAVARRDTDFIGRHAQQIISSNRVDMSRSEDELEAYISRYRNSDAVEENQLEKLRWERDMGLSDASAGHNYDDTIFTEVDPSFTMPGERTEKQLQEDFLDRYRTRTLPYDYIEYAHQVQDTVQYNREHPYQMPGSNNGNASQQDNQNRNGNAIGSGNAGQKRGDGKRRRR